MSRKDFFAIIRLLVYFLLIILLIIALNYDIFKFNCFWESNFGILCPSCGSTRATLAFLDLDFALAVSYNAIYSLILLPLTLFFLIDDVITVLRRIVFKRNSTSFLEILIGVF